MPTVTCPNHECGKSYQVSDESLGGRARCKTCGSVFELTWAGDQSGAANRSADVASGKSTGSTHSEAAQLHETKADGFKAPGQSEIPETLGRFQIKSVLGAGTFGTVYHGYDPQLDREVALKVPNVGVLRTEEEAERFLREARAAASLRHPNICPVYEANEQDGRYCIVMAFISGKTLSSLITPDTPLAELQVVSLVHKLAQALDLAHQKGVVHRDLKPGNIMFDQESREPVIMDFGLARRSSDSQMTQMGQILGTPAYMSPEQAMGQTEAIGPASDVYSLGVIFYDLLCCARPFPGSAEQVRAAHYLKTEAEPPSTHRRGIDPTLEAICMKAMSREIEDRMSMAELAVALTHYVPGTLPSADVFLPVQIPEDRSTETAAAPKEAGLSALFAVAAADNKPTAVKTKHVRHRKQSSSRKSFWRSLPPGVKWVASAGVAALLIWLGVVLFIQTGEGLVKIEILSDDVEVTFQNETITLADGTQEYKVKPGGHTLHIKSGSVEFDTDKFTLTKGNNPTVTVALVKSEIVAKSGGKDLKLTASKVLPNESETEVGKPSAADPTMGWQGWPNDAPLPAISPFDPPQARANQEAWAQYLGLPVAWENSLGMKFLLIPPGEFLMGSTQAQIDEAITAAGDLDWLKTLIRTESPQHTAVLTQPFYLGIHEVTQAQFKQITNRNPSHFAATGPGKDAVRNLDTQQHPVDQATWNDAAEFCAELSSREQLSPRYQRNGEAVNLLNGIGYRLPTEAEWEYACHAGTTTVFWNGESLESLVDTCWMTSNSEERTHPVGQLQANPFGLYDVHGNLWEWVQDAWHSDQYPQLAGSRVVNPIDAPTAESERVIRGGCWKDPLPYLRATLRRGGPTTFRADYIGFRVSVSIDAVKQNLAENDGPPFEVLVHNGVVAEGRFEDSSDQRPGWKTENGELHSIENNDKLLSFGSKHYGNFQLIAEYKITGKHGAVFVAHSEQRGDRPKGYSVGLGGVENGMCVAGAICRWEYKSGNIRSLHAGDPAASPRLDEWATLEVIMRGNKLTAKINGKVVGEAEDKNNEFPTGRAAFSLPYDTVLVLRRVRVREMS